MRAQEPTVADAMVTAPKTLGVAASIADARQALADPHVHMLLLTSDGILRGTISGTTSTLAVPLSASPPLPGGPSTRTSSPEVRSGPPTPADRPGTQERAERAAHGPLAEDG
jgi:hypothetical protein